MYGYSQETQFHIILLNIMKALKCKPSEKFAYNYSINVLSKCSNIISHRSLIFEGRHIDLRRLTHRYSKVVTLIIDLQRYYRSSNVDTSISEGRQLIFEGRHIDLQRSKVETSLQHPNIALTIRQRILSTTALHSIVP